jgi:hypothetical protein
VIFSGGPAGRALGMGHGVRVHRVALGPSSIAAVRGEDTFCLAANCKETGRSNETRISWVTIFKWKQQYWCFACARTFAGGASLTSLRAAFLKCSIGGGAVGQGLPL